MAPSCGKERRTRGGDYFSAVTVVAAADQALAVGAAAGLALAAALTGFVGVGTGVAGVAGPSVKA
jgi:hypothetical protein